MTGISLNIYPRGQVTVAKQKIAEGEKIGCHIKGTLRVYGEEVRGIKNTYDVLGSCGKSFTEQTVALCDSCQSYTNDLLSSIGKYQSPEAHSYDVGGESKDKALMPKAASEVKKETLCQQHIQFKGENKKTLATLATLATKEISLYVNDSKQASNLLPEKLADLSSDTELAYCSAKSTRAERESYIKTALDDFYAQSQQVKDAVIGYPEATDFHAEEVKKFLEFSLNNCGNWEEKTNYPLTSFRFEKQVMAHFAELFGTNLTESWGYVTNGGTDGNLWGCYLAREHFGENATLFYTDSAHYSVSKLVRMLKLNACKIKSTATGEMSYTDFNLKVAQQKAKNTEVKPIVFNTIGTTLTGAIDNITAVQAILFANGFTKDQFHLHADAALSGLILPYVDNPQAFKFTDGIDSLSVSGHKMLGSPIPCGIALARRELVNGISQTVDYIAANDLTIAGSRNGITPLHIWQEISRTSHTEKTARVAECLAVAQDVVQKLKNAGIDAWRHENSVTVVFPSPSEPVWRKHKLASAGGKTHIIVAGYNEGVQKFLDSAVRDIIADHSKSVDRN